MKRLLAVILVSVIESSREARRGCADARPSERPGVRLRCRISEQSKEFHGKSFDENPMTKPCVRIIGVYRLNDVEEYAEGHAHQQVLGDAVWKHGHEDEQLADRVQYESNGRGDLVPTEAVKTKLADARQHFGRLLQRTVAVEISVSDCDDGFDDSILHQPDGAVYEDHYLGSCWDIYYLSADGASLIGAGIESLPKGTRDFRVVSYQHLWDSRLPLRTQFGDFPCPEPSEMPARIIRLAPYFLSD